MSQLIVVALIIIFALFGLSPSLINPNDLFMCISGIVMVVIFIAGLVRAND